MNNNWEKELEIIESLGKLYPKFNGGIIYKEWQKNNSDKAWWVYRLCAIYLKRRIPRLEKFIKDNRGVWKYYKIYFGIKE